MVALEKLTWRSDNLKVTWKKEPCSNPVLVLFILVTLLSPSQSRDGESDKLSVKTKRLVSPIKQYL